MAKKSPEDPMVQRAFGAGSQEDLEKLIGSLDPAEAEYFLKKLEAALKKRKLQLSGYIVAMVAWLVGMVSALAYFGMHGGAGSIWVFAIPFLIVGVILWAFGAAAERAGAHLPKAPPTRVQKT